MTLANTFYRTTGSHRHSIRGLPKPVILDEVQRVPEIFLTIKHDVDQERIPGKFLVTGSANPLLLPRLGDSLAGRMEILPLLPLSQGEILGTEEHFIDFLFNKESIVPAHRRTVIERSSLRKNY